MYLAKPFLLLFPLNPLQLCCFYSWQEYSNPTTTMGSPSMEFAYARLYKCTPIPLLWAVTHVYMVCDGCNLSLTQFFTILFIMSPKCSANTAGGDKPTKRARNVMTLERNSIHWTSWRECWASVAILVITRHYGKHCFLHFVSRANREEVVRHSGWYVVASL